jgi:flavin-dependent dehydrogenase
MRGRPKIALIGGGIAGLATALALFRRGVEVAVYEQAGELLEIGAGIQMTPNAMKTLFALCLEQAAMRVAFEPEGQVLRSWKSGRLIYRAPVRGVFRETFGAPHCSFHRADLLAALAEPLPPGSVRPGARKRAKLNHLPSRWARFKRDVEYAARQVLYPDGTAPRVAWLYDYDVMAEEHYCIAEAA